MILSGLCFGARAILPGARFRQRPAALLAPFTYTQIAPAVLFGFLLFGAVPDIWAAVGTAVVIGAGLYVLHRRAVRPNQPSGPRSIGEGRTPQPGMLACLPTGRPAPRHYARVIPAPDQLFGPDPAGSATGISALGARQDDE